MGYTRDTIKGASWVGAFRLATRGIALVRTVILARILTPSQFGLVGIATLMLGFVEMLTETGINIFLIQEGKIEKYINTAWTVSIVRGLFISLLIIASSPFIARFFNSSDALPLLFLISLVPLIRGFINPAIVRFQKDLSFDREFWFRISIFSVDSLTAIVLAFITRSASSLIWGFIVGAFLEVVLSFIVVRPTPRVAFKIENFKRIFHRGKWVTAYSALNYAFQNGDSIVIGRVLGAFPLGLYQVGYKFATLPGEAVDSVSRVAFPVYAKIAADKVRLKRAFAQIVAVISLFSILFGIVLFLFTREFVYVLLGDRWLDVVPALKILAIFGVIRAVASSTNALFLAVRKQEYVTFVTLISVAVLLLLIIPLVIRFGIVGAALTALLGTVVALPAVIYFAWRIVR